MKLFCRHKWEMISETATVSKLQHVISFAKTFKSEDLGSWWAERKLIQVVACSKCGKLHRYVEDI